MNVHLRNMCWGYCAHIAMVASTNRNCLMLTRLSLATVLSLTVVVAQAETYPSQPVKLISPFLAGGPSDAAARIAARALQTRLGQPFIVENQAGAGGTLGARAVANAAPDGYTLLMGSVANNFGTQPVLYNLGFDPMKAFAPVATVVTDQQLMVATPSLPATSAKELVQLAKAKPGELNYGAPIGIGPHFVFELFKLKSGAQIVHVPYRGASAIITDVISGQIQLMMTGKSVLLPLVQANRLRAIAVTAPKRWPELPDVGTLVEAGYLDAGYDTTYGIVAPAGTPAAVIQTLNSAMNDALRSEEVRTSLRQLGIEPTIMTVPEFKALIDVEGPRWAEIVRVTGIKAQ
jgi:tripartite-type tricarboxylate transporter receptor subunit TctC